MICTFDKNMANARCIGEYINTLKEEKERKKFRSADDISELEIQNYIKGLSNS